MALAFGLLLIESALTLAIPYLIKVAIDQSIANGDAVGLSEIAAAIAGTFVGIYLTAFLQQYLLSWVGLQVLANLRAQLFHQLQELPMSYHDTHIAGVTISRVINDVAVINDLLSQGLITLVSDSVGAGGHRRRDAFDESAACAAHFQRDPADAGADVAFSATRPGGISQTRALESRRSWAVWRKISPGYA